MNTLEHYNLYGLGFNASKTKDMMHGSVSVNGIWWCSKFSSNPENNKAVCTCIAGNAYNWAYKITDSNEKYNFLLFERKVRDIFKRY